MYNKIWRIDSQNFLNFFLCLTRIFHFVDLLGEPSEPTCVLQKGDGLQKGEVAEAEYKTQSCNWIPHPKSICTLYRRVTSLSSFTSKPFSVWKKKNTAQRAPMNNCRVWICLLLSAAVTEDYILFSLLSRPRIHISGSNFFYLKASK